MHTYYSDFWRYFGDVFLWRRNFGKIGVYIVVQTNLEQPEVFTTFKVIIIPNPSLHPPPLEKILDPDLN